MVDTQVAGRGIRDTRVLDAMRIVPREEFISDELAEFAYYDTALPIEEAQTIEKTISARADDLCARAEAG